MVLEQACRQTGRMRGLCLAEAVSCFWLQRERVRALVMGQLGSAAVLTLAAEQLVAQELELEQLALEQGLKLVLRLE